MRKQQTLPYRWLDALSYKGSINDKERDFFRDGVTSKEGSITDLESRWLAARGYTTGTIEDRWHAYLKAAGFTGTLEDMIKQAYGTIPEDLFANGEVGVWYDPSDFLRYTDDSTLGPELVAPGWTQAGGSGIAQNEAIFTFTSAPVGNYVDSPAATTVGKWYLYEFTLAGQQGSEQIRFQDAGASIVSPTAGSAGNAAYRGAYLATSTSPRLRVYGATVISATVTLSVRELTAISTATVFQDRAGKTPVTAPEQPVGLMLDHSQGLATASISVTNGTFATDSDWTKGTGWTIGSGVATKTAGTAANLTQTVGTTAGRWYKVTADITCSAGTLTISIGTSGTTTGSLSAASSGPWYILAGSSTQTLTFAGDSSFAGTVDNVTITRVAGHHAYQATSASRPTLTARVNKATYSEGKASTYYVPGDLSDAATSITGYENTVEISADNSAKKDARKVFTAIAGDYTVSCVVKMATADPISFGTGATDDFAFNVGGGNVTPTVTPLGGNTYRLSGSRTLTAGANAAGVYRYAGSLAKVVQVTAVDIRLTAHADPRIPAYQRVGAATAGTSTAAGVPDYDWEGFPVWLSTDGTDDGMLTPTIEFANAPYAGGTVRNLLADSQYFSSANWTKTRSSISAAAATAPDGTTTADKWLEDGTASNSHFLTVGNVAITSGASYTLSVYAKAGERTAFRLRMDDGGGTNYIIVTVNLADGTLSAGGQNGSGWTYSSSASESVGSGWYRIQLTGTVGATTGRLLAYLQDGTGAITYSGDGTSGIYIWGAQLEQASSATNYQRTGVDKMTVWAGVTKLSDAAAGMVCELTETTASNNGSFSLQAPDGAAATFLMQSKGTSLTDAQATSQTAPKLAVLTGTGNIAGDLTVLRVNGAQADADTGDQGTGNYSNAVLYLFRRGGSSLPYNGLTSQIIVRGAASTASDIASIERIVAAKTGKTI